MTTTVDVIAPDVFRISTWTPEFGISFAQFLVRDEEPLLFHTGFRRLFADVHAAVKTVLDPASVRWIGFSHFEPDECGGLNEWLRAAPNAAPIANFVGANVMLSDFAERPAHVLQDGDTIETGRRAFKFMSTPHLPHGWDASLLFETTTRTLFTSDLFLTPGQQSALSEGAFMDRVADMVKASVQGPFAHDLPYTRHTSAMLSKLAELAPETLATMHGACYRGDGAQALNDLSQILKDVHRPQGQG